MAVPIWARSVAAVFGGLLVLVVWANVIKTLVVPRPVTHGLAIRVVRLVNKAFRLALSPESAPTVPARLCLRSGFVCFREVARAMGFSVPDEPDPGAEIALSYQEFLVAVERLCEVNFPIERDPERRRPGAVVRPAPRARSGYAADSAGGGPPAQGA